MSLGYAIPVVPVVGVLKGHNDLMLITSGIFIYKIFGGCRPLLYSAFTKLVKTI